MRVIFLPTFWTIVLDCIMWTAFYFSIAFLCTRIPMEYLAKDRWLFRTRPWEQQGEIYHRLFGVRYWKKRLPSGGKIFGGFDMRSIASYEVPYLERWIIETRRSELCHWILILPSVLFFLWNPPEVGWGMIVYAILFNLPMIITQRHNRPRLQALLESVRSGAIPAGQPAKAPADAAETAVQAGRRSQ